MIAKTLRKLIPALLVLALVLPCALTMPVSAAEAGGYTTVTEDVMRQIVLEEARKTAEFEWTAGEDILTLNPIGATGSTSTLQALLYQSGSTVRGPVYSRHIAASREQLQAVYGETYTRTDVNNDGVVDHKDTYGMHCATFVFDAISRVSDNYTAYGCHNVVNNEKLILLVDGVDTAGMTKTSQIFDEASEAAIYAAYDKLQPGDILNSYDGAGNVHIRIVKSVNTAAKTVTCYEQASNPWYYAANGSYTNVVTTVENPDKENELPAGTTEASVVAGLKGTYGAKMNTASYVQSARVGATYSYATLKDNLYAPYTLTDYTEGQVENADIDIVLTGKAGENDYSRGFTLDVASNYRIIKVEIKLTGKNGDYTHTVWGGTSASDAYEISFDSVLDARLNEHMVDETLTVTVTSGPVTEVGGEVPTTSIEPITIEANATPFVDGATTLDSGYYYLRESAVASETITVSGDVTLCLHGNTLINGITATSDARVPLIKVVGGGKLTICDCAGEGQIYGDGENHPYVYGILVEGNETDAAELCLDSGAITGFKNTGGDGGGVVVAGNNGTATKSTFTMNGGEISNNTAANGGGVNNRGTFRMNGGEISGNTASGLGGGIHNAYWAYLNKGTISGNTAANGGGASTASSELHLFSGSVTVTGNTATTNGGGLYSSAKNGSIKIKGGTITNNRASGNGGGVYFAGGNETGLMMYDEGRIILIDGNEAVNGAGVYITAYAAGGTNKEVKFTMDAGTISNNTATGDGGGVLVSGNSTAGSTFTMNGGEISGNTAVNGGGVRNDSYGKFYLNKGGRISGNTATDGAGVANRWWVYLYGEISGNVAADDGGGVYSTSVGLNLYDGVKISGNKAAYGGGIQSEKKIVMNGGSIIDNSATKYGGGVYFSGNEGFEMKTGVISGNTAPDGGGIYLSNANTSFTMHDGEISDNTATNSGGGVYFRGTKGFNMSGGKITRNTATSGGGVRLMYPGSSGTTVNTPVTLTMTGGEISYNTATNGGGVAALKYSAEVDIVVNGGEIIHNTATALGGGVYIDYSNELTLTSGSISHNTAANYGGGVYMLSDTTVFNMNGGAISGNRATSGGAVYLAAAGTFTMYDGIIGGDTLDQANFLVGTDGSVFGNAIYAGTGTANLYGGKIAGNISDNTVITKGGTPITTASGNGSVWISTGTVVLGDPEDDGTGTQIYGNRGRATGGIWINGAGTFDMTGGSIGMNGDTAAPNTLTETWGKTAFYVYNNANATITISGGSINGTYNGKPTVSGGEFTQDPTDYVDKTTRNIQTGEKNSTTWYRVIDKNSKPAGYEAYTGGNITGSADAANPTKIALTGDVDVASTITVTGYVILDLNGYDLISSVGDKAAAISVGQRENLTLVDSSTHYGELRLASGTTQGRAIMMGNYSTVTMNGGTITGFNYMPIQLGYQSNFYLKNGKITGNSAVGSGGAFYMDTANLYIQGGEITNNAAAANGGAVNAGSAGGRIYVTGGVISGNTVGTGLGSAMYVNATVAISGGEIEGTLVENTSGVINITGGKFSEDPTEYLAAGHWEESITEGALKFRVTKPDITGTKVNLGNALGIKFYVSINEDKVDLSDYTVKYSREYNYEEGDENAKADVVDLEITLTASDYPAAGNYMFYYTGISAKEMCDQVTLTICSGDVVMDTLTESLQSYAERTLNYSGSKEAAKKAVVDMLVYGEEAQSYFGYGLDNLATSVLTAEQLALATQADPACEKLTPAEGYAGTIISLQDNIVLKMYIDKAKAGENSVAAITYTNHAGSNVSGTAQVKAYGNNYVEVVVDTLAVADARTVVTCTMGDYSCSYSIEACVAAALASEEAEISAAEAVTVAMMKFADSAYAVLHPAAES